MTYPALLLFAALALRPIGFDERILDVRVADIDADGSEDIVAVGKSHLYLLHSGKGPAVRRPAPTLTILGRGLCGVVRDGRIHLVTDPFGEWRVGPAGEHTLLGGLGRDVPRLIVSPGDLDGDGRDDPLLPTPEGFPTAAGLVPVRPEARLAIERNESFAVEWSVPVPAVGNWSGQGRELVFFADRTLTAWRGSERTAEARTRLGAVTRDASNRLSRHHVLIDDVNGNGRLDLLAVSATGATGFFGAFEAVAYLFLDGHFLNPKTGKFFRPASTLKVQGALLEPRLVDLDSDGDLDLALATINTSILASASGTAPGHYLLFRFDKEKGGFDRIPAWTHRGRIPLTAFTAHPEPPAVFLPDLDGNGRPEVIDTGPVIVLLEANLAGEFEEIARSEFARTGPPAYGERLAALPGERGILVVEVRR